MGERAEGRGVWEAGGGGQAVWIQNTHKGLTAAAALPWRWERLFEWLAATASQHIG